MNQSKGGSQSHRATIDDFLQRNYNETVTQRQRKLMKEQKLQEDEIANMFKPNICMSSRTMAN